MLNLYYSEFTLRGFENSDELSDVYARVSNCVVMGVGICKGYARGLTQGM